MEAVAPDKEITELIKQAGGDTYRLCFQCGLCDVVCPWNRVRGFSMRGLLREAAFGLTEIEDEDIWRCTTCGRCQAECPRGVEQVEFSAALRRIAAEYGIFPPSVTPLRAVRSSLTAEGNPLNEERSKRAKWAENLPVKQFTEETEFLYFACCYLCYDPRLKRVAQATVRVLDHAGVDFGILGERENCCGESIRKAGFEDVFSQLARANIKTFVDHGVRKVLVSSPHCYHALTHDYTQFMVNFHVVHIAVFLHQLLREGKLKLSGRFAKRVVWHDPCYLGRHNGIYSEPREVLKSIPELELVEFEEAYEESLCCGGGGGRIWAETPKGERFSDIRVEQALELGADVLVTACPYCIANFEDSRLTLGAEEKIRIMDITEVVCEAL